MNPASSRSSGAVAGARRGRLEPRRGVVAEIADGAAGEARQAGHERRLEAVHQLAQGVDERLLGVGRHAGLLDHRLRRRGRAGSGTDPCRGTSSARRARRPRRFRAGTRSRSARRPSGTPTPASAGRRPAPCTPARTWPRFARSTNSSNVVCFIGSASARSRSTAAARAPRRASRDRRAVRPVHHSNCACAWATSMSRPPIVRQPARAARRAAIASAAGCRPGRRRGCRVEAVIVRQRRGVARSARCRPAWRSPAGPTTPGRAATPTTAAPVSAATACA